MATAEIVGELPKNIDHDQAEEVLRAIGTSYGLKPECLRLDDSLSELDAIDSWVLGKGQEALEEWLKVNGVTSLQGSPKTIRELIVSALTTFERRVTDDSQ